MEGGGGGIPVQDIGASGEKYKTSVRLKDNSFRIKTFGICCGEGFRLIWISNPPWNLLTRGSLHSNQSKAFVYVQFSEIMYISQKHSSKQDRKEGNGKV